MSFTSLLIDTFTRQTKTLTTDGQGGTTEAWADDSTFSGRLSVLKSSEQMLADKVTLFATHKIFASTATLSVEDRIILGSRAFVIKGLQEPADGLAEHHMEIMVLELDE